MDEKGMTHAQILDYDFTFVLKSPTGPERHHSYCPRSNRNREEAVFEKVEVVGC